MPLRLYAATSSQGKLRDFRTAAQAHSINIEPLPNLEAIPAPRRRWRYLRCQCRHQSRLLLPLRPGELVLADDSGLEVDALNGAPGVRSARFAADSGLIDSPDANDNTDVWNNIVLLQRLAGVNPCQAHRPLSLCPGNRPRRPADFDRRRLGRRPHSQAPRGTGGFGYDPLFYLPALDRSMAELDLETKLSLSHRGRAIAALLAQLNA